MPGLLVIHNPFPYRLFVLHKIEDEKTTMKTPKAPAPFPKFSAKNKER